MWSLEPSRGARRVSSRLTALAAAVALAAPAAAVTESVDLDVGFKLKVDGSIRPIDERETYVVDAPRGARLIAEVKRKGPGTMLPTFEVVRPGEAGTLLPAPTEKGARLDHEALAESGEHRVRVVGDGANDGDYRFKLKVKPQKKWQGGPAAPLAPAATDTFTFAAPTGATARIVVKADVPDGARAVSVTPPSGPAQALPVPEGGASKHVVRALEIDETGEHTLLLRNDGASPALVTVVVDVAPRRTKKAVIDLRDTPDDVFDEDDALVGRVVDEDGGVVDPAPGGPDLGEIVVDVPPGAVSDPIVVTAESIENYFVDDEQNPGGEAFDLGPDGQEFSEAVTVTMPYDPDAYDDPENELTVAVQNDDTGEIEIVPGPYDIDTIAHTVTFEVEHFSSFQSISRRARPVVGEFLEVGVTQRLGSAFGGGLTVNLADVVAQPGSRTGNLVQRTPDGVFLDWFTGDGTAASGFHFPGLTGVGSVAVTDNERFAFDIRGQQFAFRRGRTRDVAVGLSPAGLQTGGALSVLLRRAKRDPTRLSLSGKWHVLVLEFGADTDGQQTSVALHHVVQRTTVDVAPDGAVVAGKTMRTKSTATFASSSWTTTTDKRRPGEGVIVPSGRDALLTMPLGLDGQLSVVALSPVVRGDMLVGRAHRLERDGATAVVRLVFFVRAGDGFMPGDLDGNAFITALNTQVEDIQQGVVGSPRPGRSVTTRTDDVTFDGGRRLLGVAGLQASIRHDANGVPQVSSDSDPAPGRNFKIKPDGRLSVGGIAAGFVARRRGFAVLAPGTPGRFGLMFVVPGRHVLR